MSNHIIRRKQQLKIIIPSVRSQIIATIADREAATLRQRPNGMLLLGDGGVACLEFGEALGVCADAPLPRISLTKQKYSLDGVCGVASMVKYWGLAPVVCCPVGRGQVSILQRRLLAKEDLPSLVLATGMPQVIRYIRRVFASGHQLAHLETEEKILHVPPREIKNGLRALHRQINCASLLCIIDQGNAGLTEGIITKLARRAKGSGTCVIYESRLTLPPLFLGFDVVKVNHNQVDQWFGANSESDQEAALAAKRVLNRTGAKNVVYTRGARGILAIRRSLLGSESFLIVPEPKKIYDSVSAGDVVTASLAFCLTKGYSLLEAVCFAATAAELSLDQRFDKHLDLLTILKNRNKQ